MAIRNKRVRHSVSSTGQFRGRRNPAAAHRAEGAGGGWRGPLAQSGQGDIAL